EGGGRLAARGAPPRVPAGGRAVLDGGLRRGPVGAPPPRARPGRRLLGGRARARVRRVRAAVGERPGGCDRLPDRPAARAATLRIALELQANRRLPPQDGPPRDGPARGAGALRVRDDARRALVAGGRRS